jgi:HlyD family secretion protein
MRLKRNHAFGLAIGIATVALILLVMREEAPVVEVAPVRLGPFQATIDEVGVTRMRRHALVAAPVTGRLHDSPVRPGDRVVAGEVIARLSPTPLDPRALEQSEAGAGAANAVRREAEARLAQAGIALADARLLRERAERLLASGGIAPRELELAQAAEALRAREEDAARASVQAALEGERAARAMSATPASDERDRHATFPVRAPFSGVVLRVLEEHNRVVAGGTPLLEVGDPASMDVVVDVLTTDAAALRPGTALLVSHGGTSPCAASIERIEPAAFTRLSPLGVEEQRVNVIGRFAAPPPGLGDAYEVTVSIVLWRGDSVLSVPSTALVPVDSGWGVFTSNGGRARLTPVQVGWRAARDVQVLRGVQVGDSIVLHPDDRLRDGARISARPGRGTRTSP